MVHPEDLLDDLNNMFFMEHDLHLIDRGIDTGRILARRAIPVSEADTIETLRERSVLVSVDLVVEQVTGYFGIEADVDLRLMRPNQTLSELTSRCVTALDDVLDHFDHIVKLAGIDHVGIGSDYDGVGDSLPAGLKDVSSYPNLVAGLLRRGYSEEDVRKILGENLLRVWSAVEDYAATTSSST